MQSQYTVTVAHDGETYNYTTSDMETAYRIAGNVGPQGASVCVTNHRTGTSTLVREGDDQGAGAQNQNAGDQNTIIVPAFTPHPYPVLIESAYCTEAELVAALVDVLDDLTPPEDPTAGTMRADLATYQAMIDDEASGDESMDAAQAVHDMLWEVEYLISGALPAGWTLDTHDGCWIIQETETCALCEEYYPIYEASDHADYCAGIRDYPYGTRVECPTGYLAGIRPSRWGEYMEIEGLSYSSMSGSYIEVSNCNWVLDRCPGASAIKGVYGTVQVLVPVEALVSDAELVEALQYMATEYPIIDEDAAGELEQEIIHKAWASWIADEMQDEAMAVCEAAGDDAAAEAVSNMKPYQVKAIADEAANGEIEYEWLGAFSPTPTFSDSQREAVTIAIVNFARELTGQSAVA